MSTVERIISQDDLPPPHLNRLILLLAEHHGASIDVDIGDGASEIYEDDDDEDAPLDVEMQSAVRKARQQWKSVSEGLHAAVSHNVFTGKPLSVERFDAEFCQTCARYEVWSNSQKSPQAEKDRLVKQSRAEISGFNITRESIGDRIHQIMEDARKNLPTIAADAKSETSVDEDEPIEVFQPPLREGQPQTEEELRIAVEMGEAEDELMQHIQKLQVEHFNRFRRWIDVPYNFLDVKPKFGQQDEKQTDIISPSSNNSKSERAEAGATAAATRTRGANVSTANLEDMTVEDVRALLTELDIDEHASKFRRTTGKVLSALSKADIKERFQDDVEAADILWVALEARRDSRKDLQQTKTGQHVKALYDAIKQPQRAPTGSMDEVRRFEQDMAIAQTRSQLERGDLSAIKRSMNPDRPIRPSQQMDMNATLDTTIDEEDFATLTANYKAMVAQSFADSGSARAVPSGRGGRGRGGYGGRGATPSATVPCAAKTTAPPSSRRWDIVEYSDEEEDQ